MLFNSPHFLFVFLPAALILFQVSRRMGRTSALTFLTVASLVFYAWSEPVWVFVLIGMLLLNYQFATWLKRWPSRLLLTLALGSNLGILSYVKYTDFTIDQLNLLGAGLPILNVMLPIGVSFFVFQQVAYLVDTYRGLVIEHDFLQYSAFITFFPHFIAGPILFHSDLLPQLSKKDMHAPDMADLRVGLALITIGLAKKLLLADQVEIFASPVFDAARDGAAPSLLEAWGGTLAYTFQIYFDFSGYSDMAIGLGRLFGLRLPINFNSPYKATGISDFWCRWHMSLSRFLRGYLYIPLGGNRHGRARRYVNIMTVMLLGGMWHGAGWGFILWGALHGVYITINHAWRAFVGEPSTHPAARAAAWTLTFLAVVVAWVFFRAETLEAALAVLSGMAGLNGFVLDTATADELAFLTPLLLDAGWRLETEHALIFAGLYQLQWLGTLLAIALLFPNSLELVRPLEAGRPAVEAPALTRWAYWRPSPVWLTAGCVLLLLSIPHIFEKRPFLYFQF